MMRRLIVCAAAWFAVAPAGALTPPPEPAEAMLAVTGDYTLTQFRIGGGGPSCPLTLTDIWVEPINEIWAGVTVDDACMAEHFAPLGYANPVMWTVFEGGGIVLSPPGADKQPAVRFRPNYNRGRYVAAITAPDGTSVEILLERVRP